MKVLVLVKATEDSEAGVMPTPALRSAMGEFNASLVKAGILLAGDGLMATRHAKRVRFSGDTRTVTDGPFAHTNELVADARLREYHLLPSVRGDLLERLGRLEEARSEFSHAASLANNERERRLLLERMAACEPQGLRIN
jgi:hypothetical protein